MRRVALIGSSGGGTATQGHANLEEFITQLCEQCKGSFLEISAVQMVQTIDGSGLDFANDNISAKLLYWVAQNDSEERFSPEKLQVQVGRLAEVNEFAQDIDEQIADMGRAFDGIISISSDVKGVNREVVQAGVTWEIPFVGTGGTSISSIASAGGNIISGGGSVATTMFGRSVQMVFALSKQLNLKFDPKVPKRPHRSVRSIVNSMIPFFLCLSFVRFFLEHLKLLHFTNGIESFVAPFVVLAAVLNEYGSLELGPLALMCNLCAVSCSGCISAAVLVGMVVGTSLPKIFIRMVLLEVPATACSILTTFIGTFIGISLGIALNPFLTYLSQGLVTIIQTPNCHPFMNIVIALAMFEGSKRGYYHSLFLPLIILEMEHGDFATLGTLDLCVLVCISAGICLAQYWHDPSQTNSDFGRKAVWTNLLFGDFIEACYPMMEKDWIINSVARLTTISIGYLSNGVKSTAYVPVPLSILVSNEPLKLTFIVLISILLPYLATWARLPRPHLNIN